MRLYNDAIQESQLVYGDHTDHLSISSVYLDSMLSCFTRIYIFFICIHFFLQARKAQALAELQHRVNMSQEEFHCLVQQLHSLREGVQRGWGALGGHGTKVKSI